MKQLTVANHYPRVLIKQAVAFGLNVEHLLHRAGIGAEILSQPQARVTVERLATLGKALRIGAHYYSLVTKDFQIDLIPAGDEITLKFAMDKHDLDLDHLLTEFLLVTWHRFACWLIGKNIILSSSTFAYLRPTHVDEYKFLFPCCHAFMQSGNSITFSAAYLNSPIVRAREALDEYVRSSPLI